MQKTITFLVFVGNQYGKAEEAIMFYISLFTNSEVKRIEYFKTEDPTGKIIFRNLKVKSQRF